MIDEQASVPDSETPGASDVEEDQGGGDDTQAEISLENEPGPSPQGTNVNDSEIDVDQAANATGNVNADKKAEADVTPEDRPIWDVSTHGRPPVGQEAVYRVVNG